MNWVLKDEYKFCQEKKQGLRTFQRAVSVKELEEAKKAVQGEFSRCASSERFWAGCLDALGLGNGGPGQADLKGMMGRGRERTVWVILGTSAFGSDYLPIK